ncbi:unnamed protein product [Dracunculus medinensis]|uniref:Uncharacterized protein n=1 Tax=Dracunculus medinensis TaxID=318479 RepID=A0A0N4UJZ9_DRAME|nr:unnamed protein product [Dracunculus medinensis]
MENALVNIECEDGSVQEQRIENFYDLYDKLCQAFDIFLEHEHLENELKFWLQHRKIPYGHRVVLGARLLIIIYNGMEQLKKIAGDVNLLNSDKIEINSETEVVIIKALF